MINNKRVEILQDMLLLLDIQISIDEIKGWNNNEFLEVEKWVSKSILKANDNNVHVPSIPTIIRLG